MKINDKLLPSNKKFGFFFTLVFTLLFLYSLIYLTSQIYYIFLLLCLFTLTLTIFFPEKLLVFNKLWFRLGLLLNLIISPIILGFIFFFLITPISIFFKITQRDYLKLKFKNKRTYWINVKYKTISKESLKQQY